MRILLWTFLLLTAACGGPVPDDDDSTEPGSPWETLHTGLDSAVLSVWGRDSSDVWLIGADSGGGPLVMRNDAGDWRTVDTGVRGDLWWGHGPDDESVYLVGEEGLVLRYDRADDAFVQLPNVTDATLFGTWGPPGGPQYAVGGVIGDPVDPPVILRIEDDQIEVVAGLPATIESIENFFKVWGSSASDVWVIGDRGSLLHFDGQNWTHQALPDQPRLVTIAGNAAGERVIVGGMSLGVVWEASGEGNWQDVSPPGAVGLNGVYIAPDGRAVAAGNANGMLERRGGTWTYLDPPLTGRDWHAVWIDELDRTWVVGGNLGEQIDGQVIRSIEGRDLS